VCVVVVSAMDECHVSWTKEVEEEDHHRMVTSSVAVTVNGSDSTSSCGASSTMPSSPEAVSPLHHSTRPPPLLSEHVISARSETSSAATVSFHGLSALIEAATSQLEHLAEVASSQLHENDNNDDDDDDDDDDDAPVDDEEDDVDDKVNDAITGEHQDTLKDSPTKRDAELWQANFPQRLLLLCLDPDNSDIITFLPDGKFFAVRQSSFATLLARYFEGVSSFDDFVQLTERWGFSRIGSTNSTLEVASSLTPLSGAEATLPSQGIVVFRHPNFLASDAERCRLIRYGDCPEKVRMHALPSHNRINVGVLSVMANNGTASTAMQQPKRRLSPGFLNRQETPPSTATTRQRVNDDNGGKRGGDEANGNHVQSRRYERSVSLGEENDLATPELVAIAPKPRQRHSLPLAPTSSSQVTRHDPSPISISNEHARSMALSITSERLKLTTHRRKPAKTNSSPVTSSSTTTTTTLAETAVTCCTHDIVTDAIESLLRDARHSKEMYMKHEKELSKSSLPGVIPVCKHIFAPTMKESKAKTASTSPSDDSDTKAVLTLARIVTQDESKASGTGAGAGASAARQGEPSPTDSASQDPSTCREPGRQTVPPHRTRSGGFHRASSRERDGSSAAL
jgi:HSF-type DNA-binding